MGGIEQGPEEAKVLPFPPSQGELPERTEKIRELLNTQMSNDEMVDLLGQLLRRRMEDYQQD